MRLQDKIAIYDKIKELLPKYLKDNTNSALLKRPKIYIMTTWSIQSNEAYWIKNGEAVNFLETNPDWAVIKMNHIFTDTHGNKGKMGAAYGFIEVTDDDLPNYWLHTYLYEKGINPADMFNTGVYVPHTNTSDIWPGYMCDRRDFFKISWIEQNITDEILLETLARYIIKLVERDVQLVIDNMAIVKTIYNHGENVCELFDEDKKIFTVKHIRANRYEKIIY